MKAEGAQGGFLNDLQFVVGVLGLSVDTVLRKAGVPLAIAGSRSSGSMPPDLYFKIWNACHDLYPGDDFALRLGQAMAQVPFTPAILPTSFWTHRSRCGFATPCWKRCPPVVQPSPRLPRRWG